MSLAKGVLGSVIGAAAVGVVWLGLTGATGWGLGLMAIVVAGAAGYGMAQGTGGRGGIAGGLGAAAVTLIAVLGLRFATVQMLVGDSMEEHAQVTEEDAVDALARQHFERMEANGDEFDDWDPFEETWPEVVQYKAEREWARMGEAERAGLVMELEEERRAEMGAAAPMVGLVAFLFATLRPSGLVLMALALGTAFKLGSMDARAEAAARGIVLDEPGVAAGGGAGVKAGAGAPIAAKRGGGAAAPKRDEDDEPVGGGFALPMQKAEPEDDLPSIEEIRRKHAAAEGNGGAAEAA